MSSKTPKTTTRSKEITLFWFFHLTTISLTLFTFPYRLFSSVMPQSSFLSFVIFFGAPRMKNCPPFHRKQIHYPPNVLQKKTNFFFFIAYLLCQTLKLAENNFFFFIAYQLYQTLKLAQSYSKFGTWEWTPQI